jgi:uncharacterized membrane protein
MTEKNKRSLVKTITWRCIATGTTMALVYLFTKEVTTTALLGSLEATSKMIFYYFHERAWNRINWGRLTTPASK